MFAILPALSAALVALREQSSRKGVSDHHLPVPSWSGHCFHHAPQSCYKRVALHGNSHSDQRLGGFLHPEEVLDGFTYPELSPELTLL